MVNYIKRTMLNEKHTYNQNDDLEDLAPKLSGLKKENPFKVPDNYFDELPEIIQAKMNSVSEENKMKGIRFIFSRTQNVITLAAASIVILLAIFILLRNDSGNTDYFSGITLENILEENPEMIESMEDYLLVDVMLTASDYLEEENFIDNMDFDSTLHTDDMINYLSDDEIETELLYN